MPEIAAGRLSSPVTACFFDSDSRKISYLVLISFCLARACVAGSERNGRVHCSLDRAAAVPARSVVGATVTGISC
jgi:hypothetical protein